MTITNLKEGMVYKLNGEITSPPLVAQVCPGGDCAIFDCYENLQSAVFNKAYFRIIINTRDIKRNWIKIGTLKISEENNCYQPYGEKDGPDGPYYKVFLNDVDKRIEISEKEFLDIERLAFWD